jgi:hypothetical protein
MGISVDIFHATPISQIICMIILLSDMLIYLYHRLSEVAGQKLKSNNPAITDLSDEDRPLKLAEKFSQMYDDEWTDSLEEISSIGFDDETSISFLLFIVMVRLQI